MRSGSNEVQAPTLAGYLKAVRRAKRMSRDKLAAAAGISVSYVSQLESGEKTHPSPTALRALATSLELRPAEVHHAFNLAQLPHFDPDADSGAQFGTTDLVTPEMHAAIDHLNPSLAGYLDERWNVLAANRAYTDAFPGLLVAGNVLRWFFTAPAAKDVMIEWEHEAALTVNWFRGLAGTRHGDQWNAELLEELGQYPDFVRLWTREDVAFGRTSPYMHLRDPDTGQPYTVNVQLYGVQHVTTAIQIYIGVRLAYAGPPLTTSSS